MEIDDELSSSTTKSSAKISKVLQKFLDPNFKVKNDVYLNLFLTHLVGKTEGSKKTIKSKYGDQFSQWLKEATNIWNGQNVVPSSTILSFALNLASQLSEDEQVFVKLNSENIYECLAGMAQNNPSNDASITLGLVTLLCSFMEHKSGIQWVVATTYWTDIVKLGRTAHTLYIRKKAYQFIALLLQKTISFNKNFCSKLVFILIKPLQDTLLGLPSANDGQTAEIHNVTFFESLKPILILISEVTEILLKGTHYSVLDIFLEYKTLELTQKLHLLSKIEDFSFELIKIRFILIFSRFGREKRVHKEGVVKQVAQDSTALSDIKAMFSMLQHEIDEDHVKCVIKSCHYAHTLYCNLPEKLPLCVRKGEPIEFENQMVLFQIMPLIVFISEKLGLSIPCMLDDVFFNDFIQKLVKMSAIRSMELCYRWKERLGAKLDSLEEVMVFGLQYMVKTKRLLTKERAVLFFTPLILSLKDLLTLLKEQKVVLDTNYTNFINTLIDTLIDFVHTFDLTWKDSIQTISVMCLACEFLQFNANWEKKLVLSGLRLLKLAISKYMSPEMTLLLDNSKNSAVANTGGLLYVRCHDSSWEVRDSALENVHALSLNAKSKFPSYTDVLLEAELPQLVVDMALKDGEYYVRATAFKCLQELVEIEEVWNIFMQRDTFLEKILNVFEYETEGVVRKEAASLVYKIYLCQSFPEDTLPRLYDVMTHAAIGDLHWEVKCNAIDFWIEVFKSHLSNQGMIDSTFPEVTFSKEHRKIVTLTEPEVRKRLIKVLNQLSHIGCLYVMKWACLDECDVEVSRKMAAKVTPKVVGLMKKYKVPVENIDLSEPPSPCIPHHNAPAPFSPAATSSLLSPSLTDPLLDSISPLPLAPSPSINFDLSPSCTTQSFSYNTYQEITPPSSIQSQEIDALLTSQQISDFNRASSNNGMDFDCNDEILTSKFNPRQVDSVLQDLLNSNDLKFLEQIYDPSDKPIESAVHMKKATYLSPTDFLKFIYSEAESLANKTERYLDNLDEFESLLDDIIKEYDARSNVNSMDCY